MSRSTWRTAVLVALAATLAAAGAADAKKKSRKGKAAASACGIDFLPLVEGTQWTYEHFTPEDAPVQQGVFAEPPQTLTVRVVSVAAEGGKTRIKIEESYRKVVVETELVCDDDRLLVPPHSFFFAGEPGGGIGMQLDGLQVKGDSFILGKKGLTEDTFQEFKATAVRKASEGSGAVIPPTSLEIERKMTVGDREVTESGLGEHRAIRVDVQMTGRAAVPSQKDKPLNMPAADSTLWFAPGVGVVRVESNVGRGWKLTEHKTASN